MVYISEPVISLPVKAVYTETVNKELKVSPKQKIGSPRTILDISILKDPVFILFTFSNFCTSIGFYVPYVYALVRTRIASLLKQKKTCFFF